jgi:para-aminobenzoate synthetase/4-amino-4-deoxychorismate lyase
MARRHSLPPEIYALVEQTPATVLLDGQQNSSEANQTSWTQLFTAPLRVCIAHSPAEIPPLFAEIESAVAAGQYAAGFFSYECASCFEPKAGVPGDRSSSLGWKAGVSGDRSSSLGCKAGTCAVRQGEPLAWFGIYDRSYVFDHATGEFAGGAPPELEALKGHEFTRAIDQQNKPGALAPEPEPEPEIKAEFALAESEYAQRIARIHDWIRAGDVYQLNFTAPLKFEAPHSAAALYARLRARQPVDYGAFLHGQPGRHILSFSPELFFRIETSGSHCGSHRDDDGSPGGGRRNDSSPRRIVTRPMKGTARRGRTTREDRQIAEWLCGDPKNRAENVMIVDLVRNDLGRVAQTGSVKVEELFVAERYPTLWQMTSTVSAELKADAGFYDIFRALFPCGSVTGAPKVRATQLIAQLEDEPRGVYTGAIGFFSPHQTVFNVAIRTLDLDGARGTMGVGSGVVIDSDPAEEFRECLLKAEFLTRSGAELPEQFSLVETLLWDSGYPLLELHLDRLADSADYFGFACDRAAVKAELETYARKFAGSAPRKVRLLLGSDGGLQITNEILPQRDSGSQIAREVPAQHNSGLQMANEPLASGFQAHPSPSCHPERSAFGAPDSQCESGVSAAKDLRLHSLAAAPASAEPVIASIGRVCISNLRTDPVDRMLYHKTTDRPLYAQAFADAVRDGYDDVLFLNRHGEVTEGAISNVFIEKDGRWLTPPIDCGLLAGVYRRHLLETRSEIEERVLSLDDLRDADAIYLCNAVRGLRRVEIAG